jgi:hypothetical protein
VVEKGAIAGISVCTDARELLQPTRQYRPAVAKLPAICDIFGKSASILGINT